MFFLSCLGVLVSQKNNVCAFFGGGLDTIKNPRKHANEGSVI